MIKLTLILTAIMFIMSCSPVSPKMIPKAIPPEQLSKIGTDKDEEFIYGDPKVDILFVVDNSGSMDSHQKNLSTNVGRFIAEFFKGVGVDYHIGVLSTDMDSSYAQDKCCGHLVGTPAFIDKNTTAGSLTLASRLLLGVNGSGTEKSFDPIIEALSPALETTLNKGFLRKKAFLAVIFITDAEDQSKANSRELYDFLLGLKGNKDEMLLGFGAIIPSGATGQGCERDDSSMPPVSIEAFLGQVSNRGKNIFSLCAPDFGDKLAQIGFNLSKLVSKTIFLNRAPVINTLVVSFGTQIIPNEPRTGWTYDPKQNAIYLGDDSILDPNQPPDTKIRVDFEPASYVD